MNPFDTEFPEADYSILDIPTSSGVDRELSKRPRPAFYIVVATICVAVFLPWVVLRIPGHKVQEISLFRMTGGSAMVFAFFFFITCGVLLWVAKIRIGPAVTAVAVAFIGWFAVLVSVTLGAVRGMIPQVGVGKLDLGRGLIGVGPGSIIVIGALLLVAMETLPRGGLAASKSDRSLDGFGVIGFLICLALALTHTAVWVSGQSDKFESGLRLSGDSLFGSFLLSSLLWITAIVGVLTALRTTEKGGKVLGILLVISGLVKFFHALAFLLGKGIINFLLPNSVGNVVEIRSHWPLWCTLGLSILAVVFGFIGVISDDSRDKLGKLAGFEYLPAIVLAMVTLIAVFANPNRTSGIEKIQSVVNSTMSSSNTSDNGSPSGPIDMTSAEGIAKSVVLVVAHNLAGEECWSGSGVAVLDGSYILTNHHVVTPEIKNDPSCTVLSVGITEDTSVEPVKYISAEIAKSDATLDLALLKMSPTSIAGLTPLPVNSTSLPIDTKIRIIGYPGVGGNTITVNEGIISGMDRRDGTTFYKVSAQISPGNSGGPMVDAKGNLVGIATAYIPATVECDNKDDCYAAGANLGLVRPINYASALLNIK